MSEYNQFLHDYHTLTKGHLGLTGECQLVVCETSVPEKVSQAIEDARPEQRACFENAFGVMCVLPKATYCLGYTISAKCPIPIEHAWIKYDGKYYDPTFLWLNMMSEPEQCAYSLIYELSFGEVCAYLDEQFDMSEDGWSHFPDISFWTRNLRLREAAELPVANQVSA